MKLDWIKENKDIININGIEKKLNLPNSLLRKAINGKCKFPDKWVKVLDGFNISSIEHAPNKAVKPTLDGKTKKTPTPKVHVDKYNIGDPWLWGMEKQHEHDGYLFIRDYKKGIGMIISDIQKLSL